MLGPSAGNLCCFRSEQGRPCVADLVSNMVSRDLLCAEDRWLSVARRDAVDIKKPPGAASDALGRELLLTPNLDRYRFG